MHVVARVAQVKQVTEHRSQVTGLFAVFKKLPTGHVHVEIVPLFVNTYGGMQLVQLSVVIELTTIAVHPAQLSGHGKQTPFDNI